MSEAGEPKWQDYILSEGGIIDKWFNLGIDGLRLDVADELTDDFIEKIKSHIFSKYDATKFEIENNEIIESLYKRNKSDSWLYPERDYLSRFSINVNERYKFGTISIFLDMKNDIITKAKIEGDFFGTRDISEIEELLSKNSLSNIDRIISKITVSDYILGMTNEEFINLMKK